MKKLVLSMGTVIIVASLIGCGSDSSDEGSKAVARVVSIGTNALELKAPDVVGVDYKVPFGLNHYSLCFSDELNSALICEEVDLIDEAGNPAVVNVRVYGDASFTLRPTLESVNNSNFRDDILLEGFTQVDQESDSATIQMANADWYVVSVEADEQFPIDFNTTKISAADEESSLFATTYDNFRYAVVHTGDNPLTLDVGLKSGEKFESVKLESAELNHWYKYNVLPTAPEHGVGIDIGLDLEPLPEEEICIGDCVAPVVQLKRVYHAIDLTVDNSSGHVSGSTSGQSAYVSTNTSEFLPVALDAIDFTWKVADFPDQLFVNIYVLDAEGNNTKITMQENDTWAEIIANYPGYTLRCNYIEFGAGGFNTNFILRMGDSNYKGTDKFEIIDYTIRID